MAMIDEVAHPEQCRIWASEMAEAMVFAEVLPEPRNYEEVIEVHSVLEKIARDMTEKILSHPACKARISS